MRFLTKQSNSIFSKESVRGPVVLALAMALTTVTATVGCSKSDGGSVPVTVGRDARATGPAGSIVASSGISLNGWVISDPSKQSQFQDMVGYFLDATVPKNSVGYVASGATGGTGMFLGGKVELSAGVLTQASNTNASIRTDSKLLIAVYDEFVGRPDPQTGRPVPAFVIAFAKAEGWVRGTSASVRFIDDTFGWVEMTGDFVGGNFEGEFKFDNYLHYDGSRPGFAGTIGKFQVPTCQFFRCQ